LFLSKYIVCYTNSWVYAYTLRRNRWLSYELSVTGALYTHTWYNIYALIYIYCNVMFIVFEIQAVAEHTEFCVKCLFCVLYCRNKIRKRQLWALRLNISAVLFTFEYCLRVHWAHNNNNIVVVDDKYNIIIVIVVVMGRVVFYLHCYGVIRYSWYANGSETNIKNPGIHDENL